MPSNKVEIKISDLPTVKEAIKQAGDRIKNLESAIQEFRGEYKKGVKTSILCIEFDEKFKQLLEDK